MALREPNPGDRISANEYRELVRAVRALTPIAGHGMRLSRGPNGTVYNANTDRNKKREKLPWTFECHVEEDGSGRTGGWTNCRMQIGYDASVDEAEGARYKGTEDELNADGVYYAEVDLVSDTWELKCVRRSDADSKSYRACIPEHDFEHSKVNVFIGIVQDCKCMYSIHCIPVVYKYV